MVASSPHPTPESHSTAPGAAGLFDPAHPADQAFRDAVSDEIAVFLDARAHELAAVGPELEPAQRMALEFTAGGKRLRPAFCYWGFTAVAGQPEGLDAARPLLRAAASLDVLHVSALVHDDVMDASDTRRGLAAAHRQFEQLHTGAGARGDAESFGRAGAILLGDLLVMWSVQMLADCGLDPAAMARAVPLVQLMRTEVTAGQILDMVAQHAADARVGDALGLASRVVEFKSARYTVQRPVQFGAALAGADADVVDGLAAFASPLGQAFQFRDDVLGVFGDEALTGKPAGDDLREGKRTVLVAHALAGASPADAGALRGMIGDPDLDDADVARARRIIEGSGALPRVEAMISDGLASSLRALDALPLRAEGATALRALANASVHREF